MLGLTMHALANIGDIGKNGPLVALAEQLRGRDRVLLLAGRARQGRVRGVEERVESTEELGEAREAGVSGT
jgi:hypothetical protein